MMKRALAGFLVGTGLWACGAGEDAAPAEEASTSSPASSSAASSDVAPTERDVAPVARYRFVDTAEGMTIEATTDTRVTTFSCASRTCGSMCGDCAAQACSASGELAEACQFLLTSCNDSCRCDATNLNCGFPVCAADRMICYVGDDTSSPGLAPDDPVDPGPFAPAGRPSESSSNAARPSY